ncbi:MAG: hypothetical protein EON51_17745 [Acinetobacter sp.]|nr:MAG: hypothetical protein EON51_17745 [Acinetobacter sp.]
MCQHFFALDNVALQDAAKALGQDFPAWVQNTFVLTERQVSYLKKIAPTVTNFMAANASFALANRRNIVLAKEVEPEPEPSDSKITKPKSTLAAQILPDGTYTAEGELTIQITY